MTKSFYRNKGFSGVDYKEWGLHSVNFYPFEYQEEYAQELNKLYNILVENQLINNDIEDTLKKAKNFACSTIIINNGRPTRIFFDTPKQLEIYLKNYNDDK